MSIAVRKLAGLVFVVLLGVMEACACHPDKVLVRVPERELREPGLEDPQVGGTLLPEPEEPLPEDCVSHPADPRCLPGEGIYVCNSCPGRSDQNPGTPERPLVTISEGIRRASASGLPVYVANASVSAPNLYREELTMARGVQVRGRFVPGSPWTRSSAVRTLIEPTTAQGVYFPPGLTRADLLEGFQVRSAGAQPGESEAAAITIFESSPTLLDVWAGGLVPGASIPAKSVGIRVIGTERRQAMPRIAGRSASELGGATGALATALAVGVQATWAHLELSNLEVTGGQAGPGVARGVWLESSSASRIRDSLIIGGLAQSCAGVLAEGAVEGISLEGNWIQGCQRSATQVASTAAAVLFQGCQLPAPGLEPQLLRNPLISGGPAQSRTVGVAALEGCPLELRDNPNLSGGEALDAIGVHCSFKAYNGAAGRDSACRVLGNTILGGLGAGVATATGIWCEGSCANGDAACVGSCAELNQNLVNATAGLMLAHVRVSHASPKVAGNRIGVGAAGLACLHRTRVVGLELLGAGSRVENNFILAGPCEDARALVQVNERRRDASWRGPDVHSNALVGGGSSASTTGSTSTGVELRTLGDVAPPPLGRYRNNVIVGGQNNHRTAFFEADAFSDPELLQNNDFHNLARLGGPNPYVYVDEGSSNLLTAGEINGLPGPGVEANLDEDPLFLNNVFDFHLQPFSMLKGRGTLSDTPVLDFDGQPRANPSHTPPDIGADEVP